MNGHISLSPAKRILGHDYDDGGDEEDNNKTFQKVRMKRI